MGNFEHLKNLPNELTLNTKFISSTQHPKNDKKQEEQ